MEELGLICILCKGSNIKQIHAGCRDRADINVMRCEDCGLVFLDHMTQASEDMYSHFGKTTNTAFDYEAWKKRTSKDDIRRADQVMKYISGSSASDMSIPVKILDFGCGNGGFLRNMMCCKGVQISCCGVEWKEIARDYMNQEGIPCKKNIEEYDECFDIITLFHVIEHIPEPFSLLEKLQAYLNKGGLLIMETPNADDALIKRYHCKAFEDYTYWSEHVILYNNDTLERLLKNAGLTVEAHIPLQRYPLTNHMYWLAKGKGGGQRYLAEYDSPELEEWYMNTLIEQGECDTVFLVARA